MHPTFITNHLTDITTNAQTGDLGYGDTFGASSVAKSVRSELPLLGPEPSTAQLCNNEINVSCSVQMCVCQMPLIKCK